MDWLYFVLGLVAWQIVKMSVLTISREIVEYRQRKFIKLVNVRFPDRRDITFISVDSSDKRGMKKMERELREKYGIEVEEDRSESLSLRMRETSSQTRKTSSLLRDPSQDHDGDH